MLRAARRPLSAKEILDRAYLADAVPTHLYGKTQYKTLQARLSEDILVRRKRGLFFRTQPGRFFLREFLTDTSLPEEYRTPMVTRRRQRDLHRSGMLSLAIDDLCEGIGTSSEISSSHFFDLIKSNKFRYFYEQGTPDRQDAIVWSFVIVSRQTSVLSYRIGRYRDDRDTFLQKRSIGFFTPVSEDDRTLFDRDSLGIISSGIRAAVLDLDLPFSIPEQEESQERSQLTCFLLNKEKDSVCNLLAIVKFECPDWFEPTTRRLAINDLQWLDLQALPNYVEDFDPWSQEVLKRTECIMSSREDYEPPWRES